MAVVVVISYGIVRRGTLSMCCQRLSATTIPGSSSVFAHLTLLQHFCPSSESEEGELGKTLHSSMHVVSQHGNLKIK